MTDSSKPLWLTPDYWQGRFEKGDTPWELGHPSVVLMEAFDEVARRGTSVKGLTVLSPGCGTGSDAVAIAQRGANVLAVDWSPSAEKELAHKWTATPATSGGGLEFVSGDFFAIPPRPVDCVAEHTFFCAIDPSARPQYVQRIAEWVKQGGFVVGNFFILSEQEASALPGFSLTQSGEGPPFATTVFQLETLFSPFFRTVELRQANQQEPDRRPGMEWIGIFERVTRRA